MRPIDADALKEELCKEYRHFGERIRENFLVFRLLRDAPAIDAVAVVRCKDCKYHHEAHYEEDGEKPIIKHKCKLLKGYQFSENHYCGFARRKEE